MIEFKKDDVYFSIYDSTEYKYKELALFIITDVHNNIVYMKRIQFYKNENENTEIHIDICDIDYPIQTLSELNLFKYNTNITDDLIKNLLWQK